MSNSFYPLPPNGIKLNSFAFLLSQPLIEKWRRLLSSLLSTFPADGGWLHANAHTCWLSWSVAGGAEGREGGTLKKRPSRKREMLSLPSPLWRPLRQQNVESHSNDALARSNSTHSTTETRTHIHVRIHTRKCTSEDAGAK